MIIPQPSEKNWVQNFLASNLVQSPGYHLASYPDLVKLDQNEMPFDWPQEVKEAVLAAVKEKAWNRYPHAYQKDLEDLISQTFHLPKDPSCVLLAPGSNLLIGVLIETFGLKNPGEVWVLRPSFPLYEERLTYAHRAYIPWELKPEDGSFDVHALNAMTPFSVVIFASPNNPTGAVLLKKDFSQLLSKHPKSLFIADEAYFEFADEDYLDLLQEYSNLIIVRTFSKTAGAAALRLGYALGSPELIKEAKKTMLPFLINPFTLEGAKAALTHPKMKIHLKEKIKELKTQRDFFLKKCSQETSFRIFPSGANFFLIQWPDEAKKQKAYEALLHGGILVRDVSKGKGLSGCLRVSLGQEKENHMFINILLGRNTKTV